MKGRQQRREIWWLEPRWSYQPKAKEAVAFADRWQFWISCVLFPYAVFVVLTFFLAQWLPEVNEKLAKIIIGGAAAVVFLIAFLRFGIIWIPPMVAVNRRGIYHGGNWIVPQQIKRLTIDARDSSHRVLIVDRIAREKRTPKSFLRFRLEIAASQNSRTIGIGRRIQSVHLGEFLEAQFRNVEVRIMSQEGPSSFRD